MNEFMGRYGATVWSAIGIGGGLYLVGRLRGETLLRATAGAMVGAWIVNMSDKTGANRKPAVAPAKQGGTLAGTQTGA